MKPKFLPNDMQMKHKSNDNYMNFRYAVNKCHKFQLRWNALPQIHIGNATYN